MEVIEIDSKHSKQKFNARKMKRRNKSGGDSWVMSFADVVTVLLCFFIIFYMIEKQYKKQVGFGSADGSVQAFSAKMATPEVLSLIETMKSLPQAVIINKAQFMEVHFPPEMFFASGETKLTSQGLSIIEKIVAPLSKIKTGYSLQIQGYTDSSSVTLKKGRWWKNNMELSLERSLEVYEFLLKNGIEKNILSVTGFGASKPLLNQDKNMQRRITLKFEPVLGGE